MRSNFTILGLMIGFMLLYLWMCTQADDQPAHADIYDEGMAHLTDQHSQIDSPSLADSIILYAQDFLGTDYIYGNGNKNGFDCSGFTCYVYDKFGIDIPRSSTYQATAGEQVPYSEARKGDLIIFTGTNPNDREPGHVGIVISRTNSQLTFIHSSSAQNESGVKISEVEGTGYKERFLEVRRVVK